GGRGHRRRRADPRAAAARRTGTHAAQLSPGAARQPGARARAAVRSARYRPRAVGRRPGWQRRAVAGARRTARAGPGEYAHRPVARPAPASQISRTRQPVRERSSIMPRMHRLALVVLVLLAATRAFAEAPQPTEENFRKRFGMSPSARLEYYDFDCNMVDSAAFVAGISYPVAPADYDRAADCCGCPMSVK